MTVIWFILLKSHIVWSLPPVQSLSEKLVDNRGQGLESLYGVRNFRAVLPNVLYRGGANNKYLKEGKRNNHNPLPEVGLKNLCQQGFSQAVYLYDAGFDRAPASVSCAGESQEKKLSYSHISPFNKTGQRELLQLVYKSLQDPTSGPLYFHCWNGWHASGFISALALRQFCDMSGEHAWQYWTKNTDGFDKIKGAEKLKKQIVTFEPIPDLKIPEQTKQKICLEAAS